MRVNRMKTLMLVLMVAAARFAAGAAPAAQAPSAGRAQVVIVVDGLRPDFVTPEIMPRLSALGRRGVIFASHHSVFPTVTRVNASSMATGVYPEAHGLLGNNIYIPAADPVSGLNTGQREALELVARATGRLLTAPTLGELMQKAGKTLMTIGSGSSGSVRHPRMPCRMPRSTSARSTPI